MSLDGLDPLATDIPEASSFAEFLQDSRRRDVLNILRSYTGPLDVFSEAVQNCIDAVELKSRQSDGEYSPTIWITIDVKGRTLRFIDNGLGMDLTQLSYFVKPSISFKKNAKLRGHKGVGATFLAYGYTAFSVFSKHNGTTEAGILSGGRQWAESSTSNVPRPRFSALPFAVAELEGCESGTCIEIVIGDHRDERPNLNWLNITNPDVWFKVLRIRTPVGGVYLNTGGIKPTYHLTVIDASGEKQSKTYPPSVAEFYLPHEYSVCQRREDLDAINTYVDKHDLARKDVPQKLPSNMRNLDCIWNIWSKESLIEGDGRFEEDLTEEQKVLVIQHNIIIYGCFVRSRTVWDSFQKDELNIRPKFRVIQGGLQLASDHMIQGDLTTIPLTTAAGYQANAFIIVHFTDGNPDMGRKVFQPELKELAEVLSRRVVAELRKYQALLKPDTGAVNSNLSKQLEEWKDAQKEWAKSNPLRLSLDGKNISFLSPPQEEQDVIALFHQLVGMNMIKGILFYGTGYNTRYDGLIKYKYTVEDRYGDGSFWGVDARHAPSESGAQVLEYKYSMDALIRDFQKDEKSPQEVDLLVCWQIGSDYKRNFEIVPLTINQDGATREFFGSTHALYIGSGRATKVFEIVCLSDFLLYYQDPAALFAKQASQYP